MENDKQTFAVGEHVHVQGFGDGEVTFKDMCGLGDEAYIVFHVRFDTGETRHFRADDLAK